jgi:hypothetical protein
LFAPSLRVIRRQVTAHPAFPDQIAAAIRYAVQELLTGLLPDVGRWAFAP